MLQNDLLLRVLRNEEVIRPPVWILKQSGKILPQFNSIRAKAGNHKNLVRSPDLVSSLTVQAVNEYDVDAAILFSDILILIEAMGIPYKINNTLGPIFKTRISSEKDIENLLCGDEAVDTIKFVCDSIDKTVSKLENRVPLIGLTSAPWSIFCYMVEGKTTKSFSVSRKFLRQHPILAHKLLDKITTTIISYLRQQREAGVDVVQIFDAWAGLLDERLYRTFCVPYLRKICLSVGGPKIIYARGAHFANKELFKLDCIAIGLDWTQVIGDVRSLVGNSKVLQGNIDPSLLYAPKNQIEQVVHQCINDAGGLHIVNLGHGVYADTPQEGIIKMVRTVKDYKY